MKAIVYRKYGSPDVLEFEDVDKPVPADDEVLVRVRASSVNPAEWHGVTGLLVARTQMGLRKPKETRLGADFAGIVEAVGANRTDFARGDEVFGGRTGAFAEYVSVRNAIAPKPANVTFEQAAAVPIAALTALQGLRDKGQLRPGQKVLINGASGGVGTFAVQIAKALGAAEVTAVCSTRNVDRARSLGADRVVDYTQEDFTRSNERYDLLLDIAGGRSWRAYKRVLKPDAKFVLVGSMKKSRLLGPLSHVIKIRLGSLRASQTVKFFIAKLTAEDVLVMKELIESGKVTPYVERTYPLSETAEALRYLGQGHAEGKIVITVP